MDGSNGDQEITETKLRRWLTLLDQPDRLTDPELAKLVRSQGLLPPNPSHYEVGRAAASLLTQAIERLKPEEDATRAQTLPYEVLSICFLEGAKLFQAAGRLGLSERQLTRERTRAIALLKDELLKTLPKTRSFVAEPIPAIRGFLPRPGQERDIQELLEERRMVNVSGPAGIGKTTLIAELARHSAAAGSVIWYRFRPGINVSLNSVLLELGEYLAAEGAVELEMYTQQALPSIDATIATRLALKCLSEAPHLIVFDDFHLVSDEDAIAALLDEITLRVPAARVITIGRHRYVKMQAGAALEMAPFSRAETEEYLRRLRVECGQSMLRSIHRWTGGNPQLLRLAASWLKTADDDEVSRGVSTLDDHAEVHSFLLSNITDLLDSDDRALLEAASIFRDRFSDDALGFVVDRTRGAVQDAAMRLERAYVATRNLEGDTAFFHASVRDYVYERLDGPRRRELHERAAMWYRRRKDGEEAAYHERLAEEGVRSHHRARR